MTTFRKVLGDLVAHYGGSKQKLAAAIGISPSAFSRLAAIQPSVEVCLRLANATGANPSRVLRAAGRSDIADLLEDLYGHAATRRAGSHASKYSPSDFHTLDILKNLPKAKRRAFDALFISDDIKDLTTNGSR